MASINERINFFGFQDDKLIYDERKKRFVHTSQMPAYIQKQYQNNQFKVVSTPGFIPIMLLSVLNSNDQISMV